MREALSSLEHFKVAQVMQQLLSQYNHNQEAVRHVILDVLSGLAVAYPEHSAWWIYRLHFSENDEKSLTAKSRFVKTKSFSELLL